MHQKKKLDEMGHLHLLLDEMGLDEMGINQKGYASGRDIDAKCFLL